MITKVKVGDVEYSYNIEGGSELIDKLPAGVAVRLQNESVFHPSRVEHVLSRLAAGVSEKDVVKEEVERIEAFEKLVGERDLEARMYSEWQSASVFLKEICRNIRRVILPDNHPCQTALCGYRPAKGDFSGEFIIGFNRRFLTVMLANRPSGFARQVGTSDSNIQNDTAWGTHVHEMYHFGFKHVGPDTKMTDSAVLDNYAKDLAINGVVTIVDDSGNAGYGHSNHRSEAQLEAYGLFPGYVGYRPSAERQKELHAVQMQIVQEQIDDIIVMAREQGTSEGDIKKLVAHFEEKAAKIAERLQSSADPRNPRAKMRQVVSEAIASFPPLMSSEWYAERLRKAVEDAGGKWTDTGIKLPGDPDGEGDEAEGGDGEGDEGGSGSGMGSPGSPGKKKGKSGKGKPGADGEPSDEKGEGEGGEGDGEGEEKPTSKTPRGHKKNELTLRPHDDHSDHDCDGDPEAAELAKQILRRAARAADHSSNGWGNMPSAIRERIRDLIHGGVSWQQELRQWVGQRTNGRDRARTIKRLDRKQPLVQSGLVRNRGVEILVILDESGSVGEDVHSQFYGALDDLSKQKSFTVAPFDTAIALDGIFRWKRGARPVLKRVRCGGTDFDAAFEWAQKEVKTGKYHGVIMLTDGGCSQPRPLHGTQVLWVLGPNDTLPFSPRLNERVINVKPRLTKG